MSKEKELGWSNDRLKDFIRNQITGMFTSVLDFAEVAVDGKDRFQTLRSKVLRVGNDTIRSITKELDLNYEVKYTRMNEDVILVGKKGGR